MNERENRLRAWTFNKPERIPISFHISLACWDYYDREELENLMLKHEMLFPDYIKGSINFDNLPYEPRHRAGHRYTDSWSCEWETSVNGMTGSVVRHPLEKWEDLGSYVPPDPGKHDGWGKRNWSLVAKNIKEQKNKGQITMGNLRHGYMLLMLSYIRGFENLSYDLYDEELNLYKLIDYLEKFNAFIVKKYISLGVDFIRYPEDLGTQSSLMISPNHFRKYIKPSYKRLMSPTRENNILVYIHSDGYIMEIIDDLIECGVQVLNLQDMVNGIDDIQKHIIKRNIAVELDIDRQIITVMGTPKDIDDLVHEEVSKLASFQGGLSLFYDLYPGAPIQNVKAVMDTMEKYCSFYS